MGNAAFSQADKVAIESAMAAGKLKKLMVWHAFNDPVAPSGVPGLEGKCSRWDVPTPAFKYIHTESAAFSGTFPTPLVAFITTGVPTNSAAYGSCSNAAVVSTLPQPLVYTEAASSATAFNADQVTGFSYCRPGGPGAGGQSVGSTVKRFFDDITAGAKTAEPEQPSLPPQQAQPAVQAASLGQLAVAEVSDAASRVGADLSSDLPRTSTQQQQQQQGQGAEQVSAQSAAEAAAGNAAGPWGAEAASIWDYQEQKAVLLGASTVQEVASVLDSQFSLLSDQAAVLQQQATAGSGSSTVAATTTAALAAVAASESPPSVAAGDVVPVAQLAGRTLVAAEQVADSLQQLLPLLKQQHKGDKAAAAALFSSTVEEVAEQLHELALQNSRSPAAEAAEEALARLEAGGDIMAAGGSEVQIVQGLQQEAVGLAVLDLKGLYQSRGEQLLELVQARELSRKMAYDQVGLMVTGEAHADGSLSCCNKFCTSDGA
eukprot:gene6487-6714_t